MAQQIDIIANIITKVDGAEKGINQLKNSLSKLKLPEGLDKNLTKSFANLDGIFERYRNQLSKGFQTKGDVTAFAKTGKELETELNRVSKYMTEITGKKIDFKVNSEPIRKAEEDLAKLIQKQQELTNTALKFEITGIGKGSKTNTVEELLKGIQKEAGNTQAGKAANAALANLQMGDVNGAKAKLEEIITTYNRLGEAKKQAEVAGSGMNIAEAAGKIKANLDPATKGLQQVKNEATSATEALNKMRADQISKAANEASKMAKKMDEVAAATKQADKTAQDYATSSFRMTQQLGDLQQSTQYFFSLRNMINLFKQGIRDAVQSVKELDAAMTETAVVTDYKVSDMWNMLPEYTQLANQLGATTQGAYETMTLYFQQGLDQTQAFEIGAETMKMARIAGLDYAKTTDMMTAALRGFNMELNETSAKRVNDVYSELAAITASDTKELGTAMQRTASIAHSAGMSFEGTTAFLAQAIETTREPAENIGTAMKTIIARFQEMKKNPLEITDVEGEEVNYNKVDTALQSIGVSLKDTNGQFRELDQVFLDISQRWDGLTQTQQRYIATIAAGSRQQSRFIAMMDNYDRTVQLMTAANNSAGASDEQFGKTMDSLESKLNKLHNAWQAFTMGIANNNIIKFFVDGTTTVLSGINSLIDTLSMGSGALKSFLSLFTAFTGLKAAGKIANSFIGGLGGLLDPKVGFGKGFFGGAIGTKKESENVQAKAISDPIVNVLNQILGAIKGGTLGKTKDGGPASFKEYKEANTSFRTAAKQSNATIGGLFSNLSKLDGGQVRSVIKSNPGITAQLQRSFINSDLGNVLGRQLMTGLKQGSLEGSQLQFLSKANIGKVLGTQEAKNYSDNFAKNVLPKMQESIQRANENAQVKWASGIKDRYEAEAFMNEDVNNLLMKKTQDVEGNWVDNPLYDKDFAAYAKKNRQEVEAMNKQQAQLGNIPLEPPTKADKLAQGIGHIGSAAISAGQGCMALGNTLNSMGFEEAGSAAMSFGSTLSNLGSMINGLPSLITALGNPAVLAGTLAVGAIAGVVVAYQNHIKNIKEAAEKVTTDFKDKSEEAKINMSNLESYQSDFARLREGVDKNGLNVSLDSSDYDRYLEIIDEIARLNPEIVEGYNAQGHAIINNNKALEDTIAKQEEVLDQATEEYLSPESSDALKRARDLQKTDKYIDKRGNYQQGNKFFDSQSKAEGYEFKPQTEMRKQAQQVGQLLQQGIQKGWADEKLLSDFNIDVGALAEGNDAAIEAFTNNYAKVRSRINSTMDAAGDDIKDKTKESMLNAFTGFSEASDELDELITPYYEQLAARMSQSDLVNQIPDEMRAYFNQGLKDIASDANEENPEDAAEQLAKQFAVLSEEGSGYYEIMEKVAEAQDEYAASLDEDAYKDFVENTGGAVDQLEALRDKLLEGVDTSKGYGKAISEFFDNEIAKVRDFTEEGTSNLKHALNTMTDEISAAEGALDSFNTVAEGSNYTTAATNLSKIYEEATQDMHTMGKGDQTFWAGAEALVGRDSLIGKSKSEAQSLMKQVNDMLSSGEQGWTKFKDHYFQTVDAMGGKLKDENGDIIQGITYDKETGAFTKIDEDINPKVYEQMARALQMSKESLIAMLNVGRQFGEIDFKNLDEARKAIATSDSVIEGRNVDKNGNRRVYVKEDTLNSELAQGDLTLAEQEETKADLEKNYNIKAISKAGEITAEEFKDMGIKSMESLIDVFDSTGNYTKDEIAAYAKKWSEENGLDYSASDFNEKFADHISEMTDPEGAKQTSQLTDINSTTASILSVLASQRIEQGHLDVPRAQEIKDSILGRKGVDTMAQWFSLGKNEKGKVLTKTEYEGTHDELVANKEALEKYKIELDAGRAYAEEHGMDTSAFDEEIKTVTTSLDYLNKYIEAGEKAWEAAEKEKEADAKKKEEEKRQQEKANTEADKYKNRGKTEEEKTGKKENKDEPKEEPKASSSKVPEYASGDYWKNRELGNGPVNTTLPPKTSTILGEIANQGFADLFSSVTPESINTDAARQALESVYQASLIPNGATLTQGLMSDLQTLGIDIQDAIDSGLVVDTNGIYSAGQQAGKNAAEAGVEGNEEGQSGVDTSGAKETGKKKGKETAEAGVKGNQEGQSGVIPQPGDPNFVGPTLPSQTPSTTTPDESASKVVAAEIIVENEDANSKLQDTQTIAENVASVINKGATFTIKTPGARMLGKAALSAQKISEASGTKTMSVNASVEGTDDVDTLKTSISGLSGKTVTVNVSHTGLTASNITSIGTAIGNLKDKTITVTINKAGSGKDDYPHGHTGGFITGNGVQYKSKGGSIFQKKGTDTVPAMLTPGEYVQNRSAVQYFGINFMRKINHKDLLGALQSFGSAAKGKYGTIGPKDKGGLTLTGEKGFEIAWIPSENRSMILGTNGPQMLNLPNEAVVYTHEQSKKILKQKSIPAGSHVTNANFTRSSSAATQVYRQYTGPSKIIKHTAQKVQKDVEKTTKQIQNTTIFWENIARQTAGAERIMEANSKAFEKYIAEMRATLKKTGQSTKKGGGGGDLYLASIGNAIGYYKTELKRADKELNNLDKGTSKQRKARSKEAKAKANKAAYKSGQAGAVQITYKAGKKDKTKIISTASLIKQDKKSGAYIIDEKKVKQRAKSGEERNALIEALNKEINDRTSKKTQTEDKIAKLNESYDQFSKKIYDTFFSWEISLTRIWNLTQQIQNTTNKLNRLDGFTKLLDAQLSSGVEKASEEFNKKSIQYFQLQLKLQAQNITNQEKLIEQYKQDIAGKINISNTKTTLSNVNKKLASDKKVRDAEDKVEKAEAKVKKKPTKKNKKALKTAKAELKTVKKSNTKLNDTQQAGYKEYRDELKDQLATEQQARKYTKITKQADGTIKVDFNTAALETDKLNGNITKDEADAIQKWVQDLVDSNEKLHDAYNEYSNLLAQSYEQLKDLKSSFANMAEDLVDGLDDQAKEQVSKIKTISENLSRAFNNLIDEVKNKLDARRQIEDNAKTEQDISRKQQRLTMLRADTAGGHASEIAQLEKELADSRQNYQRTLEDQKLDAIRQQGEEAAKQRERIIEIQEATLDQVHADNVKLVEELLQNPKGREDEIRQMVRNSKGYDDKTIWGKESIDIEAEEIVNQAITYPEKLKALQDQIDKFRTAVEECEKALNQMSQTVKGKPKAKQKATPKEAATQTSDKVSKAKKERSEASNEVTKAEHAMNNATVELAEAKKTGDKKEIAKAKTKYQAAASAYSVALNNSTESGKAYNKLKDIEKEYKNFLKARGSKKNSGDENWGKIEAKGYKAQVARGKKLGKTEYGVAKDLAQTSALTWEEVLKAASKAGTKAKTVKAWNKGASEKDAFRKAFVKVFGDWNKYATGGLADFTGPAWLDGTSSKPELVLNAQDTKNFIALKDVLSKAISNTSGMENSYGNATYEININVDHLNNDYDVDKVVERVKKKIVQDSGYRNVTQVRNFR